MHTILRHSLGFIFAAGCVAAFGSAASADTLRFYNNSSGSYTGEPWATSAAFTAVNGAAQTCPTSHSCTADYVATTEGFTSVGGVSVTASVNVTNGGVWSDVSPAFGGLGVSSAGFTSTTGAGDDQIDTGQTLTLTFGTAIDLQGVLTLFDSGHTPFGGNTATGSIVINGTTVSLANANNENLGVLFNDVLSLSFTVGSNSLLDPEYYVSGLVFTRDTSRSGGNTPLPAALPLFASGLGALGLLGWRRKRKAAALAA